jgi:hypothetical protein
MVQNYDTHPLQNNRQGVSVGKSGVNVGKNGVNADGKTCLVSSFFHCRQKLVSEESQSGNKKASSQVMKRGKKNSRKFILRFIYEVYPIGWTAKP